MDEQQIKEIAQKVYDENQKKGQFGVFKVPNHVHNGVDSPLINQDNIISGTYSSVGLTSTTSEIFTVETFPSVNEITLHGVASNGSGKKASLSGFAAIGNCFQYGAVSGSVSLVQLNVGSYSDVVQSSSSIYIDTSDLAKTRVNASGNTLATGTPSYIVYVADDTATIVASLQILRWSDTSITFQSVLGASWYIACYLTMS